MHMHDSWLGSKGRHALCLPEGCSQLKLTDAIVTMMLVLIHLRCNHVDTLYIVGTQHMLHTLKIFSGVFAS